MEYTCFKCKTKVKAEERFLAYYGEVLCPECSKGVEPCSDEFELLFDIPNDFREVYYYFNKTDLMIKAQLESIEHSREEVFIRFAGGSLSIWKESKVLKVKKPRGCKGKFEFCYSIGSCDGDSLGYIGKPCKD